MGWTLVAGVLAAAAPALGEVLLVPTALLAGWVSGVARWSAALGVPGLRSPSPGPVGVAALGIGVVALLVGWLARRRAVVMMAVTAVAGILVVGALTSPGPPAGRHPLGIGAEVVVGGGRQVLIVDGRAVPGTVVGGLRRVGVDRVDVVVARTPTPSSAAVVAAVTQRLGATQVLAPVGTGVPGATVVAERLALVVGERTVAIAPGPGGRLDVVVGGPV